MRVGRLRAPRRSISGGAPSRTCRKNCRTIEPILAGRLDLPGSRLVQITFCDGVFCDAKFGCLAGKFRLPRWVILDRTGLRPQLFYDRSGPQADVDLAPLDGSACCHSSVTDEYGHAKDNSAL